MKQEEDTVGISAEDRQAMCEMLERLLVEHFDDTRMRQAIESEEGFDRGLWTQMAELGLLGILISEERGGIGGGLQEVEAFMEIAGKALFTSPYISSSVIAPTLLIGGASEEPVQNLLGEIAAGESIVVPTGFEVPLFTRNGFTGVGSDGNSGMLRSELDHGNWSINGEVEFAQYISSADKLLLVAEHAEKLHVYVCEPGAEGLSSRLLQSNDQTLRLSTLQFKNVAAQQLIEVNLDHLQVTLDAALAASAGEQAGASKEVFARTIDYLKTRFQFGRPIGSFQALKHMVADLLVEVESMTSVARAAAEALATDSKQKDSLISLAAFTCKDGFRHVTAEAIQLHGGIAYTLEHFAHLYWRRAQSCRWLYGAPNDSRERYLSDLEKLL